MLLDILTASDWHFSKIQPLLESIEQQTMLPDRVVILIYTKISKEEQELFVYYMQRHFDEDFFSRITIISHLNSNHEPWRFHGYDRSVLLSHAKSKFSYLIDGDNVFNDDHIAQLFAWYDSIKQDTWSTPIISPTIMWRKSGKVQSQWITWFRYFFPKYQYATMWTENWQQVKMIWANSLLGLTSIFQKIWFDERFAYCYEDIDFTYRLYLWWYPVTVLNKVETYHMESSRWVLWKRFLDSPVKVRYRSRNRILFVQKNANLFEKIQYFWLWLWIQTIAFFWLISVYWGKKRKAMLKNLYEWTKAGLHR